MLLFDFLMNFWLPEKIFKNQIFASILQFSWSYL